MKKSSKKFPKISGIGLFFELDGRRKKAVIAMIEEDLTNEELGSIAEEEKIKFQDINGQLRTVRGFF